MAFTKGVHRIFIDTIHNTDPDNFVSYYCKDQGDWETVGTVDGNLQTNKITGLLDEIFTNKIFNLSYSLAEKVSYGSYQHAAIHLPNIDGTIGKFGLDFGGRTSGSDQYGEDITSDVEVRYGVISAGSFSTSSNSNYYSGLMVLPNNSTNNAGYQFNLLSYFLLVTVFVDDDFYSIGLNNYMYIKTYNEAVGSYINTGIIIGKTDKNNNYLLAQKGATDYYSSKFYINILDSNNNDIFKDNIYLESPYQQIEGIAKVNKLTIAGNDLGWYYVPAYYKSLQGLYSRQPNTGDDRSVYISTYNFNRFIDNAVTIGDKSFDIFISKGAYGDLLLREHK